MAIDPTTYEDDAASLLELDHIYCSDNLPVLRGFPDNSIDALVCDPPAAIGFMQSKEREWDSNKGGRKQWIAWLQEIMEECLRVMKPGAHGFVWALPRTSHWTMCALEDAGFEIRDVVMNLFSQGMPKSHNIGLNIDKAAGAERKVISIHKTKDIRRSVEADREKGITHGQGKFAPGSPSLEMEYKVTAPATPEAEHWDGWGSSLKPAVEYYILVRKPLAEPTIVKQVLKTGTGAINIAATRVTGTSWGTRPPRTPNAIYGNGNGTDLTESESNSQGRWPAHLLLSHAEGCTDASCQEDCPIAILDAQSGVRTSGKSDGFEGPYKAQVYGKFANNSIRPETIYGDTGGASRYYTNFPYEKIPRFIYMPKSSPSDRTMKNMVKNDHPTVKSTHLMAWLCRLITPPGGIVLDPFMGSGSTLVGAIREGFHYIGIDNDQHYCDIAEVRTAIERERRV